MNRRAARRLSELAKVLMNASVEVVYIAGRNVGRDPAELMVAGRLFQVGEDLTNTAESLAARAREMLDDGDPHA